MDAQLSNSPHICPSNDVLRYPGPANRSVPTLFNGHAGIISVLFYYLIVLNVMVQVLTVRITGCLNM